jgi:hypothetical protein
MTVLRDNGSLKMLLHNVAFEKMKENSCTEVSILALATEEKFVVKTFHVQNCDSSSRFARMSENVL